MKHSFPFLGAMLTVLTTFAAAPNIPELKDFRAPAAVPREYVKGFLWLEAESFADYGEWKLDTQFTHKMGSAYLIAAGLGKPIQSASRFNPRRRRFAFRRRACGMCGFVQRTGCRNFHPESSQFASMASAKPSTERRNKMVGFGRKAVISICLQARRRSS